MKPYKLLLQPRLKAIHERATRLIAHTIFGNTASRYKMKKTGRYDTSGLIETQFEPGSRGRVLKNLLGIKSRREMDQLEAESHGRALKELLSIYDATHRFAATDIRKMHKI
ncbi:MAG: hypothetical protein Q7J12_00330, partial [Syntrophales bacterium]|nr:hypothetical protein [Syntrophales bacterium]